MPLIAKVTSVPAHPTYATAAHILDILPATVTAERVRRHLSVAVAAKAMGVTTATLTGLEAGSNCTRTTATAALRWLAT